MKHLIVALLVLITWTAGSSQTLSFKFGTPFRRDDLEVRWQAPANALPSHVWVYRLLPNRFSPEAISYLMSLGPFMDKDRVRSNADGMFFAKPGNSKNLSLLFKIGAIDFQTLNYYGPTNLAKNVPAMSELPGLTTDFLKRININIADIVKQSDGAPEFHFSEPFTEYFVNYKFITNIAFRSVSFRRAVEGAEWVGGDTGGDCHVDFGEFSKPYAISLSWRKLQRYKAHPAATVPTIINWIRHGRAVQNMIPMDADSIEWSTVKSVTVTRAEVCYYAGGPFDPSDWLMPFVALWTTVDRGQGKIDVEIDSPVIESSRPADKLK